MAVNLAHGQLRRRLVTPDKMSLVEETIGKDGADRFLDSGITGVTPGKVYTSTPVFGLAQGVEFHGLVPGGNLICYFNRDCHH